MRSDVKGGLSMEDKIRGLKKKLEKFETRELLGMIGTHFITFGNNAEEITAGTDIFNKTKLMSPQKQYVYLAGLLMSTNFNPDEVTHQVNSNDEFSKYEDLEKDIQDITMDYIRGFINFKDSKMDDQAIIKNLVSMEAFTSYFDMDVLRYEEQTIALIESLYKPFDIELIELTQLSVEDYLVFYKLVEEKYRESYDRAGNLRNDFDIFFESLLKEGHDIDKLLKVENSTHKERFASQLVDSMDALSTVKKEDVIAKFGKEKADVLLEKFSLTRKERDFKFYNGLNPFTQKPLSWIDDQVLFIVHPKFLLSAIYDHITTVLEDSNNSFSDRYKKLKADTVEELVLEQLKKIFGDNANYHMSVCEESGTKEHDLLIEYGQYIIVGEVKASKVREPFFNPDKAFVRIRDHFFSASGIGGAYNQAINLKRHIETQDSIVLYEDKTIPFELSNIREKKIIPCVFTLNQFGGIAINTSMLLQREKNQPYPWVCNLHDLENIVWIIEYLKKVPEEFMDYLQWRIEYHEKIMSSDELDIFEGYLFDFKVRKVKQENLFFWPTGPSLIDKIYFESHGIPYSFPPLDMVRTERKKKIGRNDPCPCGSGKKYKKCCIDKK